MENHESREGPGGSPVEYMEVLVTSNPAEIAFIKSLLDDEEIEYFFQGEESASLFSTSTRLMVDKEQAARVRELLKAADFPNMKIINEDMEEKD